MLANVAANHLASGKVPGRYGNGHPNIVPYRTFAASDGDVAVAVGNDEQFRKLAGLLGHPEWNEDERFARNRDRVNNRDVIDGLIAEIMVTKTRAEWIEALDAVGIPRDPSTTWPRRSARRRPWVGRWSPRSSTRWWAW
jgi:crotonobetainyl-CoA:carnitine CoA-transferase CaiB-like acyl-CoA transferase